MKVWMPYAEWIGPASEVSDAVDAEVYDGEGTPPSSIGEVEFYVPPYMSGRRPYRLVTDMPGLRVVQTLTAGVDHIRSLVPAEVTLCNARGVHDASTAELAVALTLASLRGLPDFVRGQDREHWADGPFEALADKTVLIVGYGAVGAAVESRLAGFEVAEVLRVARSARDGVAAMDAVTELLPRADVVVLTVPMTEQTRGLVDAAFLARMRDGALLVNVARGAVVRTDDLVRELQAGRLRAALDVTDPEPLPPGHPLWHTPGTLISPHTGGNTSAFLPRALRLVLDQLRRYTSGAPLENVITGSY